MAKTSREERIKKGKRFRRRLRGAVFTALAIIGAAAIVWLSVAGISRLFNDEGRRQEYANLIQPLVMLDPVPFSEISRAEPNMLLEAAIWSVLMNEDLTRFERDQYNSIIIPAVDVERYAASMYGPDYYLSHGTFSDMGIEFKYENSAYTVPSTSSVGSYTADVVNMARDGNLLRLRVAYIYTEASSSVSLSDSEPTQTIVKYMTYNLLRQGGDYYIYSVEPDTQA